MSLGNGAEPSRIAIVVSHPIQHFVPFYRALSLESDISLKVFFASRIGLESYFDKEMRTEIAWNMDLVSGYDHEFLPEANTIKEANFLSVNNPSLGRALDRYRPHVVLAYGYGQLTQLRALLWCRLRNRPIMLTGDSELRSLRSASRRVAKEIALRSLFGLYDAFLTVGDANEEYWGHFGVPRVKMFRTPFTIDEHIYRKTRAERKSFKAAVRSALGIPPDAIFAICVGKLSARKRPLDLVEAASILKSRGRRLHCVFAGGGALLEPMRAKIADLGVDASLLGSVNVDKLPEAYAAADVLAHPSEADPHPLVMSEAACIGLPLVLSDRVGAEGPTDIARSGVNAKVFRCGDAASLADAIEAVAFDSAELARLGAGSLRVFDELDVRTSVAGLKAAVRHCLASQAA